MMLQPPAAAPRLSRRPRSICALGGRATTEVYLASCPRRLLRGVALVLAALADALRLCPGFGLRPRWDYGPENWDGPHQRAVWGPFRQDGSWAGGGGSHLALRVMRKTSWHSL